MEANKCPSCGAAESPVNGRCPVCGFGVEPVRESRSETPGSSATPTVQSPPMCVQHPTVQAVHRCAGCQAWICTTCDFVIPRPPSDTLSILPDTHLCPKCMSARSAGAVGYAPGQSFPSPTQPLPDGVMCKTHPAVQAVRRCGVCSAAMCQTCDFELPGYFHLCPTCATTPQKGLSKTRKMRLGISYALAVWSTIGIAVLLSGALAGSVTTKSEEEALGIVIGLLVFAPSIVGTALAVSVFDRRLVNPPAIWVAAIWNGAVLAALILISIIGALR